MESERRRQFCHDWYELYRNRSLSHLELHSKVCSSRLQLDQPLHIALVVLFLNLSPSVSGCPPWPSCRSGLRPQTAYSFWGRPPPWPPRHLDNLVLLGLLAEVGSGRRLRTLFGGGRLLGRLGIFDN